MVCEAPRIYTPRYYFGFGQAFQTSRSLAGSWQSGALGCCPVGKTVRPSFACAPLLPAPLSSAGRLRQPRPSRAKTKQAAQASSSHVGPSWPFESQSEKAQGDLQLVGGCLGVRVAPTSSARMRWENRRTRGTMHAVLPTQRNQSRIYIYIYIYIP